MEGIITVFFGLLAYFLIVDFPEDAHKSFRFLKDEEIKTVIDRINRDRRDVQAPPFRLVPYLKNALDWKIWLYAANFGLTSVVTYAAAYFLPIVLRQGLGFSEAAAQCLSTPVSQPYLIHSSGSPRQRYILFQQLILCDKVLRVRFHFGVWRKCDFRSDPAPHAIFVVQLCH